MSRSRARRTESILCSRCIGATCCADLQAYLASGERRVQAWQARQRRVEVSFDDIPEAFRNINTLEELASLRPPP